MANAYGVSVEEALIKIAAEHPTIAKQFKQCSTGSKTIPPEVLEVYAHQVPDAVGVLYGRLRRRKNSSRCTILSRILRALSRKLRGIALNICWSIYIHI